MIDREERKILHEQGWPSRSIAWLEFGDLYADRKRNVGPIVGLLETLTRKGASHGTKQEADQ
jgi:hypothetical protein